MSYVVTVAALPVGGSASVKTNDPFVDAFIEKMNQRGPSCAGLHTLLRASTLYEAEQALEKERQATGKPPDVLQIVGHGHPGALGLGASFGPFNAAAGEVYVLDSDPDDYALADRVAVAPTRVMLLGCNVGEATDAAPDGPTLLFDLSQLWRCEVLAPVREILDRDFDACGLFIDDGHTLAVALPDERKVLMPVPAQDPSAVEILDERPVDLAAQVIVERVLYSRRRSSVGRAVTIEESARLLAGPWARVADRPGLLPELRLAARRGEEPVTVEVLSAGRRVRVGGAVYARLAGEGRARSQWDRGDPARRRLLMSL